MKIFEYFRDRHESAKLTAETHGKTVGTAVGSFLDAVVAQEFIKAALLCTPGLMAALITKPDLLEHLRSNLLGYSGVRDTQVAFNDAHTTCSIDLHFVYPDETSAPAHFELIGKEGAWQLNGYRVGAHESPHKSTVVPPAKKTKPPRKRPAKSRAR